MTMHQPGSFQTSPPKDKPRERTFIVQSAQEAVQKVKEALGPTARVVSVRQVKGVGLQRFLGAPRLEIIARADEEEEIPVVAEPSLPPDPGPDTTRESESILTCRKFLDKAGLSSALLSRMDAGADWRRIGDMGLREGLPLAARSLWETHKRIERRELAPASAFIGGPGAGKTTALCKLLARDVFIRLRQPQVLRLEVDKPHLDDGLLLYCDVLGVRCTRSAEEIDFGSADPVYVDIPGYSLREEAEVERIGETLDRHGIEGRVLVMNAAYEESVLKRFSESGRRLGAQFQVLTHLDELQEVGKLWRFLFDRERTLLFFSDGQNIAGDRVDDTFNYLLERTFPQ